MSKDQMYLFTCRECGESKTEPTLAKPMCYKCKTMMEQGIPDIYQNQALFLFHYLKLSEVPTEDQCKDHLENVYNQKSYEKWRKNPLSTPISPKVESKR